MAFARFRARALKATARVARQSAKGAPDRSAPGAAGAPLAYPVRMPPPTPEAPARPVPAPEPRVHGEAIVYRLYDVGYEIRLDRVVDLLASSAPERPRPVRGEAQTIQIPNPPVTVSLGWRR